MTLLQEIFVSFHQLFNSEFCLNESAKEKSLSVGPPASLTTASCSCWCSERCSASWRDPPLQCASLWNSPPNLQIVASLTQLCVVVSLLFEFVLFFPSRDVNWCTHTACAKRNLHICIRLSLPFPHYTPTPSPVMMDAYIYTILIRITNTCWI